MSRTCITCAAPITRQSTTGRCRTCATRVCHADPVMSERRKAAHRAACADPAYRARMSAARARTEAERKNDPKWRAYKVASGKRLRAAYDASAEGQALNQAKRALVGEKARERMLSWCPVDRRADYRTLREKTGAADARRMIEADIAQREAARLAAMTPFERQMERVRNGAQLVAKPDTRRSAHDFTLGGVATGLI